MKTEYGTAAMYQCPRFYRCNAPICPLDPDWRKRIQRGDEAVCAWLMEMAKPSWAEVSQSVPSELIPTLVRVAPEVIAAHGRIRREVERASKTGSKVLQGRKLGEIRE